MSDYTSRHRPLMSRQDLNPAERSAVRSSAAIVLAMTVAAFAVITTLALAYPGANEMLAMMGP